LRSEGNHHGKSIAGMGDPGPGGRSRDRRLHTTLQAAGPRPDKGDAANSGHPSPHERRNHPCHVGDEPFAGDNDHTDDCVIHGTGHRRHDRSRRHATGDNSHLLAEHDARNAGCDHRPKHVSDDQAGNRSRARRRSVDARGPAAGCFGGGPIRFHRA
jgi:hypothetical protein